MGTIVFNEVLQVIRLCVVEKNTWMSISVYDGMGWSGDSEASFSKDMLCVLEPVLEPVP